jgi:hypothetical protein
MPRIWPWTWHATNGRPTPPSRPPPRRHRRDPFRIHEALDEARHENRVLRRALGELVRVSHRPASRRHEHDLRCVVCLTEPLCAIVLPCAHVCLCMACAARVTRCPVCRGERECARRVYLVGHEEDASPTSPAHSEKASDAAHTSASEASGGR